MQTTIYDSSKYLSCICILYFIIYISICVQVLYDEPGPVERSVGDGQHCVQRRQGLTHPRPRELIPGRTTKSHFRAIVSIESINHSSRKVLL